MTYAGTQLLKTAVLTLGRLFFYSMSLKKKNKNTTEAMS